jgi:hypothetical protein
MACQENELLLLKITDATLQQEKMMSELGEMALMAEALQRENTELRAEIGQLKLAVRRRRACAPVLTAAHAQHAAQEPGNEHRHRGRREPDELVSNYQVRPCACGLPIGQWC